MKKYIYILILLISSVNSYSHTDHYKGISKIEMDVIRNDKVIGYSNYFFEHEDNKTTVKNYTKFNVDLFGVSVFSILSETTEIYENDMLIHFKSNTFQNEKEKYVNLNYDEKLQKFIIDGSSFKGKTDKDKIVGTWWNHEIIKAKAQISAISGRIIEQKVEFIGKEKITINGKTYNALHFNFKSSDETLPDSKKLNTDIWYEEETFLWLKAAFDKRGYFIMNIFIDIKRRKFQTLFIRFN